MGTKPNAVAKGNGGHGEGNLETVPVNPEGAPGKEPQPQTHPGHKSEGVHGNVGEAGHTANYCMTVTQCVPVPEHDDDPNDH